MARLPKKPFKRVYWDSCAWIALINNEVVSGENRGALCRAVIDDASKSMVEIFTSALALVEVNKHPSADRKAGADKLKDFFENDYIVIVPLDRRVGELARAFMQRGYAGLKPPDASHLASAAVANVQEMHTFDQDLLNLDGKLFSIDGSKIEICKPSMGGPPLPLLESDTPDKDDDLTETN